ncbi:MAG TPA: arylsulfotransferase family protein [Solirubrobacteraceae bacterium]|nr:arylsulfotransferase family protein [Solirubrobacteraceae bacterium]
MRRAALAALGLVAVAAAIAAAVLAATGGFSGASRSPACLTASIEHSAQLPASSIYVSPAPGTVTANPSTQISFLGVPRGAIRAVSVLAQRSGLHAGRLLAYSQGDGASFVPDRPFAPGEQVSVTATIAVGSYFSPPQPTPPLPRRRVSFSFRVDTPYPTTEASTFPNPAAQPSDYQSFATLPGAQVPTLTVTVPDRDPAAGNVLTTNGPSAGQYGALIYSPQGRAIWFDRPPHGLSAENLDLQHYQGRRVLTLWQGKVLSLGFGQGEDLVLNSRYQTIARTRGGNGLAADLHDFRLAPNGVAYATAFNPIRCDLRSASGPADGALIDTAIQEIDLRTGLVRWEWHALDHVAVAESETSPPKGTPWDWFHLNSIDLEPGGDLLISARSTWAAYQLQRGSGEILWRLGGNHSSFTAGAGTKTAWQHDARMLPSGEVTMFDDGSNPPEHPYSRGVRLSLDARARRVSLRASYFGPQPPLLSASQGNMQTLPSGNVLLGFGGIPEIREYSAAGGVLFAAHLSYDMSSYRAFRFPWSAQPASPPAVLATLNSTDEETIVRASWNGATGVASWRVLAGPSLQGLRGVATFPDSGFESETILTKRYRYVAVQAIDASGRPLAVSQTAQVGPYAQ